MTDLGNYTIDQEIVFAIAIATAEYSVKAEFNGRIVQKELGEILEGANISLQVSELNEDYTYCAKIINSDGAQVGDDYRFRVLSLAQ